MFFVSSAYATLDLALSVLPLQRNPASAGRRGTRPLITCESLSFYPFGFYFKCFLILIKLCLSSQPVRCGQATVLQCDKVCAAVLNCAEHTCVQVCHSGTCQPCQLQVQQGESHFGADE